MNEPTAQQDNPATPRAFIVMALVAGGIFFASLNNLWPLAAVDLARDQADLLATTREKLQPVFPDIDSYLGEARLTVDGQTLDYLEQHLPREQIQALIAQDSVLFRYQVFFKRRNDGEVLSAALHPNGTLLGWVFQPREDRQEPSLTPEEALQMSQRVLRENLDWQAAAWMLKGTETRELPARVRHRFTYERPFSQLPLRERLLVIVDGDRVTTAVRRLVVPEQAKLAERARQAPRFFLEGIGFSLLGLAGLVAIFVFFTQLRRDRVRLQWATTIASVAFLCGLTTMLLQRASRFIAWDPMWPRFVADFQYMLTQAVPFIAIFLLVLVMVAAGDALDRGSNHQRGRALFLAARLQWTHPVVLRECRQGFLLGLCCGGALAMGVLLLQWLFGAVVGLQPRGFFYYAINASSPAAATLLFFLGIALIEECGYRFFGGTWLEQWTGKRWLAIVLPAIIYGLTHTRLNFLPPVEPFWGRAVVLTMVGCVWGWGFFRFGALAVVISHFTADLFIFNWPRLASGDYKQVLVALATVLVPLTPLCLARVVRHSQQRRHHDTKPI